MPPPAAQAVTAAVADVWIVNPPGQKPPIKGVRKLNFSFTLTVIRLPGPSPARALEQGNVTPELSTHAAVADTADSPR